MIESLLLLYIWINAIKNQVDREVFPKNYYRKLNNIFYAITISVANRYFHYNRSNKIARYFFFV